MDFSNLAFFQSIPILIIFLPILTAVVIYMFQNKYVNFLAFVTQGANTVLAVIYYYFIQAFPELNRVGFGNWSSRIGIALKVDTLTFTFIFLSLFMWWVVLIYSLQKAKMNSKFLFFLLFLEGVFLGLLQTDDLFNLFVFIELTTILATILIAFQKTGKSFRAGLYYLLLNTSGVLFFLIGVILLYNVFGTMNMTIIQQNMHLVKDYNIIKFSFVLMLAGVSVKSALFPVFTWLPRAHGVAMSSISALLSGLIVKGGVYLFIRLTVDVFSGADYAYSELFFYIGAITSIVGFTFALCQKEMKQILAYHTISQVGIILMGVSALDYKMQLGGLLHIVNHAMFKSLLFLGAGVIIHNYHKKEVPYIRGVFKTMPLLSILMIIGMLSITGAPFFNGYVSKSIIKYGVKADTFKTFLMYFINLGTATSFIKMSQIFFGPKQVKIKKAPTQQIVAMSMLGVMCLVLGVFHVPIVEAFFQINISNINPLNLEAFVTYFLTLLVGYAVYYFVIKKDGKVIARIRKFNLSFESANYLFLVYIFALVVFFVLI